MKFRKKPVIVEAVQWFKDIGIDHPGVGMEPSVDTPSTDGYVAVTIPARYYVITIHEQKAYVTDGDWLIPEPKLDRYYPCKPDIFEQNYEPVNSPFDATIPARIFIIDFKHSAVTFTIDEKDRDRFKWHDGEATIDVSGCTDPNE